MGMYNEVFKRCPEPNCEGTGYMQVPQVVLGFGGFHLDNLDSLSELTEDELRELHSLVMRRTFRCDKCHTTFHLKSQWNKALAQELFGT